MLAVILFLLDALAAFAQHPFLYHSTSAVDANDTLYRGDPSYLPQLQATAAAVVGLFVEHLQALRADPASAQTQALLAASMFSTITTGYVLNAQTAQLAYNLATLAKEYSATANHQLHAFVASTVAALAGRTAKIDQELYKKLSASTQ